MFWLLRAVYWRSLRRPLVLKAVSIAVFVQGATAMLMLVDENQQTTTTISAFGAAIVLCLSFFLSATFLKRHCRFVLFARCP